MITFSAEVFEEFLAVNEISALGLGYSSIDFLTDGLANMGLPVGLHEGVESLGDDGLSVLKLPSLHFFANQLFEFGTERDIHQAADPSLARTSRNQREERGRWRMRRVVAANPSLTVGALNLQRECDSFRGGFDIFRY